MNNTDCIFNDLFVRYPQMEPLHEKIREAYRILCECYENGGKVLACGNGGSAADSEHIVGELMKGFISRRKITEEEMKLFEQIQDGAYLTSKLQEAVPAISLTGHQALISAYSNDVAPDMVYAQQVWGYAKKSPDVLIALSTSGNSANIINAVKTASALGRKSIGITGSAGSLMSDLCTVCIQLPEQETYKVQELTLPVYHALCAMVEATYF